MAPIFDPNSLVGLSPEEIFAGARLGQMKSELQQKSLMEALDYLYKMKYGAPHIEAQTRATEAQAKLYEAEAAEKGEARTIGVRTPDGNTVMLTPKEYLAWSKGQETGHTKDYAMYFDQEVASGRTPKSFESWVMDVAKAGATRIGTEELLQRREGMGQVKAWEDFADPKYKASVVKQVEANNEFAIDFGKFGGGLPDTTKTKLNKEAVAIVTKDLIGTYGEENVGWQKMEGGARFVVNTPRGRKTLDWRFPY